MGKAKPTKLMGVDIGFSDRRETTGIAWLDGDTLHLSRAGTSWESRRAKIPSDFMPDVIAVDGPLLPQGTDKLVRRRCELIFICKPFHNRCKPGLSDFGTGLKLRRATAEACTQFGHLLAVANRPEGSKRLHSGNFCDQIVEAFPNAFLAVLLTDREFLSSPKLKRGQRFDWLYERAFGSERVKSTLSQAVQLPDDVWHQFDCQPTTNYGQLLFACLPQPSQLKAAQRRSATRMADGSGCHLFICGKTGQRMDCPSCKNREFMSVNLEAPDKWDEQCGVFTDAKS